MTSRSMPSRGTKYSFWRAEAGFAAAGGACLFGCLEAMAGDWDWLVGWRVVEGDGEEREEKEVFRGPEAPEAKAECVIDTGEEELW